MASRLLNAVFKEYEGKIILLCGIMLKSTDRHIARPMGQVQYKRCTIIGIAQLIQVLRVGVSPDHLTRNYYNASYRYPVPMKKCQC